MSVKTRFIISDLHLADGQQSILEDFDEQCAENFINFFDEVSSMGGVKVIINGDFIDFPQILLEPMSTPPHKFLGSTEIESVRRLKKAIEGHSDEFDALRNFLAQKGNELLLIPGNHDIDFCWNRVLKTFRQRIGATDENFKFGMIYKEAGVYVTHGHQYSDDNTIDVPINFTFNRLNCCWGSLFMERFFNMVEEQYPMLDNIRPEWKVVLSSILNGELSVTGQLVAEALIFLKNYGIPLQEYVSSGIFGWKPKARSLRPRDIDALTSAISSKELRQRIRELRDDPVFKREFDATLEELPDNQWDRLFTRSEETARINEFLQESEPPPHSRALFMTTDNYQQAATVIARYHPGTRVVIMGHTHRGIDDEKLHVEGEKKEFRYYNTGTWTETYIIPWWKLPRLETLQDRDLYTLTSSVVRCTGAGDNLEIKYANSWKDAVAEA